MLNLDIINKEEMLSCPYSKRLLGKLCLINLDLPENSKIDIAEVEKGICYAKYYHGDQKRDSGDPYYSHPLEVANMVAGYLPRTDMIITAILHDTIEDTTLTKEEIIEAFGVKVAEQVCDLTRIKEGRIKISSAQMIEDLWIGKKLDVLMIKIFDRLHNMQTISSKSPEKIKKIAEETIKNFLIALINLDNKELYQLLKNLCIPKSKNAESELQRASKTILHSTNSLLPSLNSRNILRQQHNL
jgi:(p)ppGpp synthase/HD superfamily hydrolase